MQEETRLADDMRKRFEIKVAGQVRRWRRLTVAAYAARGYRPFTYFQGRLTAEGRKAIELILDVDSHGLELSPYPVDSLRSSLSAHDDALQKQKDLLEPNPGTKDLNALTSIVTAFDPRVGETYLEQRKRVESQLLKAGLTDEQDHTILLNSLDVWASQRLSAEKAAQTALGDIELSVIRGFFQYALDFQLLTVAHPFKAVPAEDLPSAPRKYQEQLLQLIAESGDSLGTSMQAMWPQHPYYVKSKTALATYRELAKPGVVPVFKARGTIRRKHKGKKVLALKARLAAMGYYEGDENDPVFGTDLVDAVKDFQRHHQLDVDGRVSDGAGLAKLTKRSIQVTMNRRVRMLKLSLQRWRESASHKPDEPFYFRVNIPQFEVEVWDQDTLVRKHRIVVGNNKMEIDQDHGRKGYLNRTALISDAIERIVLNPVWNVPERIRIQEILVEAAKDQEYMEKNGYKVRQLNNGREQIYQEAGPTNALGRVKILFPNKHAIYMHDTPKRRLFKRTIRAFSHGCMRLHEPVEMAEFLLQRQGLMTSEKVKAVLDSKKERGIRLKEKVPIHIEYNTVAFDPEDDRPIFLNDIYKYDRAYWGGDLPLRREEKIPVVKTELPVPEWEEDPRADDTSEEAVEGTNQPVSDPADNQVENVPSEKVDLKPDGIQKPKQDDTSEKRSPKNPDEPKPTPTDKEDSAD
jgi:murein L,D-transpeptidase YcbB/YkuD